jgi:hypothetical protein
MLRPGDFHQSLIVLMEVPYEIVRDPGMLIQNLYIVGSL